MGLAKSNQNWVTQVHLNWVVGKMCCLHMWNHTVNQGTTPLNNFYLAEEPVTNDFFSMIG